MIDFGACQVAIVHGAPALMALAILQPKPADATAHYAAGHLHGDRPGQGKAGTADPDLRLSGDRGPAARAPGREVPH